MTKPSETDEFLLKWQDKSDNLLKWYIPKLKTMLKKLGKFIPILIGYTFMSWIFIGLYDSIGFEKTLLLLLVGVFWYGLRQRV